MCEDVEKSGRSNLGHVAWRRRRYITSSFLPPGEDKTENRTGQADNTTIELRFEQLRQYVEEHLALFMKRQLEA